MRGEPGGTSGTCFYFGATFEGAAATLARSGGPIDVEVLCKSGAKVVPTPLGSCTRSSRTPPTQAEAAPTCRLRQGAGLHFLPRGLHRLQQVAGPASDDAGRSHQDGGAVSGGECGAACLLAATAHSTECSTVGPAPRRCTVDARCVGFMSSDPAWLLSVRVNAAGAHADQCDCLAAGHLCFTPLPPRPSAMQYLPPGDQWTEWQGNDFKCDGVYLKEPAQPAVGEVPARATSRQLRCVRCRRLFPHLAGADATGFPSVPLAGCVAMPGYRFYKSKTVDCSKYQAYKCALGFAGSGASLAGVIEACNADEHCLAVDTSSALKVQLCGEAMRFGQGQRHAAAGTRWRDCSSQAPPCCAGLPACHIRLGRVPRRAAMRRPLRQNPQSGCAVLLWRAAAGHAVHGRGPNVRQPAWRHVPLRRDIGRCLLREVPYNTVLRQLHAEMG